jgi:hypothetical protein
MHFRWTAALLLLAYVGPLAAQQLNTTTTKMEVDLPEVMAEVKSAFDRYEQALVSNDAAVLGATFRDDPRTIRYGIAENLYGYKEIEAFRANSSGPGPRQLSKTVITTYGHDFAVASTLSYRAGSSGVVNRQMQTWVRFPEGWRVAAAHVSNINEPPANKP